MKPPAQRWTGKRAPTKGGLLAALRSVLYMRRHGKPLSQADVASFARCYGRTEAQVIEEARAAGCEVRG
jgi:phosphomannomutase